jgi:hypothetical protein
MKRLLLVLVMFVPFIIMGQGKGVYFSTNIPDYIPYGKPFDIFATIKLPNTDFDGVNFYILPNARISIQDLTIYNSLKIYPVETVETEYGDFDRALKLNFQKSDTLLDLSSVFRLKFSIAQIYEDKLKIHYAMEFIKDGKIIQTVNSFSRNSTLQPSVINFYKTQSVAGRNLLLQEDSKYSVIVEQLGNQADLLVEFWAKFSNLNSDFIKIENNDTQQEYFSIGINENNFVYLRNFSRNYYTGLSLGRNSWYHFAVYFINNKVTVYCNQKPFYENNLPKSIKDESIKICFLNGSPDSYMYLKQLRLWNYQDDIEKCFNNKQYPFYSAERSELLYQNNFNDELFPQDNGIIKIADINRLRIVQSDAPIISRAPEINISVFASYCSIEWSNKDNQKPKNFTVEKSRDGQSFSEIFRTTADEDLNKVYYYSDKREETENITYYRVRQINYDGSEVYSSSLKVGQSSKKERFKVGQNYPNPFNPTTSFTVDMLETSEAVIKVYDLVGKVIKTLHEGTLTKGEHTFSFDGSGLTSGIYFYEIKASSSSIVKKMILTK